MPVAELTRLAREGDLTAFETRCLEFIEQGVLRLADIAPPFELLKDQREAGQRVAALAQLVLESTAAQPDPPAALRIASAALWSDPDNGALRSSVSTLYREVYGHVSGFDTVFEHSGLDTGRPARNAIRMLSFCLTLRVGDILLSRTEDVLFEVTHLDHARGLYTVTRNGRPTTLPTVEMARRYENIDSDDFRVLRELRPQRLAELIDSDPVALVIGLIRSHGEWIDQDTLKAELSPQHVPDAEWAKWWTRARTALKRSQNIVLEGRSPLIIRYSPQARTLEDETWEAIAGDNEPLRWLDRVQGYLRELKSQKLSPDAALLQRVAQHAEKHFAAQRERRPAEAIAAAAVIAATTPETPLHESRGFSATCDLISSVERPGALLASLDESFWDMGLAALLRARPDEAGQVLLEVIPRTPATLLDEAIGAAIDKGQAAEVQRLIENAVSAPLPGIEILYWLWKGPRASKALEALQFPPDEQILGVMLSTLADLGKTLAAPDEVIKRFRQRAKSALALKDYSRVRRVFEQMDGARAITIRQQITRADGLGDNTPARLFEMLRELHPTLWKAPVERRLAPWEDPTVLWTTKRGLDRKMEERDVLVNVTMRENAQRIGEAAALGDLSENSEYKFALEERDLLRARLAQINSDLSLAQPIEPNGVPTEHVGVGSRVVLKLPSGEKRRMTFLGPFDTDVENGVFNYKAPTSLKLMGLRIGDKTRIAFGSDETDVEVAAIENGLALA